MSVLLIAEHNNKELRPFTLNAVTAASQIDQDVHAVIIGHNSGEAASALLNWPQATFASKIDVKDGKLEIVREIDEGLETIEVNIPAIVTCDLRLNEPRYASLPNIMKAKKKPVDQLNASDLGVDISPRVEQIKVEEPPKRKAGIKVANVTELVQKLKNEAKVI